MWPFALAGGIVIADQATKWLIQTTMVPSQSIEVAGHLLRITYIQNPSAAFGLDLGSPFFYMVFAGAASLVVIYYLVTLPRREYWPRVAMAMILAGAIGNLIDRIRLGKVVDFIQIGLSEHLVWPIFNVADMGVSIGVTLLVLFFLVVGDEPAVDEPRPA